MKYVDVFGIGIGIPKTLYAVRPPFRSVAAIPEEAEAVHFLPLPLAYANIAFSKYVFSANKFYVIPKSTICQKNVMRVI